MTTEPPNRELAAYRNTLRDMYVDGFADSGRTFSFTELEKAFNAGFDAGRSSVKRFKIAVPRRSKGK